MKNFKNRTVVINFKNNVNIAVTIGKPDKPLLVDGKNTNPFFNEAGYYLIEEIRIGKKLVHFFPLNRIYNIDFRLANWRFPSNCYVITDPPYNIGFKYNTYSDKLSPEEYCDLLKAAVEKRKSIVIHHPEETINILPRVTGTLCQEVATWVYNVNTPKQSRSITWWGCKPDFSKVGQEYKNPNDPRIKLRIAAGKKARIYDWWFIQLVKNVSKKMSGNPHKCTIPEEVIERIILTTTEVGDIIVDPFAGSGTVLKVAKKLGRKYLGFEIDRTYYRYMKSIGL